MKTLMILFVPFFVLFANDGEKLFDEKCISCHIKTKPTKEMKSSLVAPPISGVMKNMKSAFNNDRKATLDFINDYIMNPSLEKSKCKPKALKRFGVMPSQSENLTSRELKLITAYIYNNFPISKQGKKNK